MNWFFSTIVDNNLSYFPAEYTVGVFSLENGIEDLHHVIVSAKIPLGFRREALETSQTSHNIPVEYPGGETDFATMYRKLVDFLEPRKILNKYPPLYTTNDRMGAVQSLIKRLSAAASKLTFYTSTFLSHIDQFYYLTITLIVDLYSLNCAHFFLITSLSIISLSVLFIYVLCVYVMNKA